MSDFIYPSESRWVTDSFDAHVNRNPTSPNPGTDYGLAYGSRLYAPANGTVVEVDDNPSGGAGRFVGIDFDNGFGADLLHLSSIAHWGGRVSQGELIGYSGGSAWGSDWGVDPHVHISLRPHHGHHLENYGNVDFEDFVGRNGGGSGDANIRWDQERLNVWAEFDGVAQITVDGINGPETAGRVADFQSKHGLEVDGIAGPFTDSVLVTDPPHSGITVDGILGPETIAALQDRLRQLDFYDGPIDGVISEPYSRTVQGLQSYLNSVDQAGLIVDGSGLFQNGQYYETVKAVQRHTAAVADGIYDVPTSTGVERLQIVLNAGTF